MSISEIMELRCGHGERDAAPARGFPRRRAGAAFRPGGAAAARVGAVDEPYGPRPGARAGRRTGEPDHANGGTDASGPGLRRPGRAVAGRAISRDQDGPRHGAVAARDAAARLHNRRRPRHCDQAAADLSRAVARGGRRNQGVRLLRPDRRATRQAGPRGGRAAAARTARPGVGRTRHRAACGVAARGSPARGTLLAERRGRAARAHRRRAPLSRTLARLLDTHRLPIRTATGRRRGQHAGPGDAPRRARRRHQHHVRGGRHLV